MTIDKFMESTLYILLLLNNEIDTIFLNNPKKSKDLIISRTTCYK